MASETKLDTLFYDIELRTQQFEKDIDRSKRIVASFAGETASVKFTADGKSIDKEVARAKKKVAEIPGVGNTPAVLNLTADISILEAQLTTARKLAAQLGATKDGKPLQAKLDADITAFEAKLAQMRAGLATLSTRAPSVKVDAQTKSAEASIKKLGNSVESLLSDLGGKLNVAPAVAKSVGSIDDLTGSLEIAGKSASDAGEQITRALTNPYVAVGTLATAVIALGIAATKAAADFDTGFRHVQAALSSNTDVGLLATLKRDIIDLSQVTPRTAASLTDTANAIARMGESDPAEIARDLRVLALAGDAAGETDLRPLADQLDLLHDAFGLTGEGARQAFIQIAAMAQGRIELSELNGVLARSATRMNALGITAQDAAAAMVVLVDAGVNSRQITTGLIELLDKAGSAERAATQAAADGRVNDAKALHTFAQTVSESNIRSKGLVGTLGVLYEALGRNKDRFQQAGLTLNDFQIAQKAASAAADGATSKTLAYDEAIKKVGASAQVNRESAASLAETLKSELAAQLIDLGNVFLPTVIHGLQLLVDLFSATRREAKALGPAIADATKQLANGQIGKAFNTLAPSIAAIRKSPGMLDGMSVEELRNIQGALRALQSGGIGGEGLGEALGIVEKRLQAVSGAAVAFVSKVDPVTKVTNDLEGATKKLADEQRNARDAFDKLIRSFDERDAIDRFNEQITEAQHALEKAKIPAAEVTQRVNEAKGALSRRLANDAAKELRDYAKALEESSGALTELMRTESDKIKVEQQARDVAEFNIESLQNEAKLLGGNARARDDYVRSRQKELAVMQARFAESLRNGHNDESVSHAGQLAGRLFDAQENIKQIQAVLQEISQGGIAASLGNVAAQFTSIATSLGQSGQHLARVAGVLGPLLTGVSGLGSALKRPKLDSNGNLQKDNKGNPIIESLGFIDTIAGKNGIAAQSKAIASTVAILGAAAQIADALDLFGTHARERARQLKEAARQFDVALHDFVASANPSTGATAAIEQARKKAEDLAKQAAAAGGGTITFDGEVTSGKLREVAASLQDFFNATKNLKGVNHDLIASTAKDFADLADGLDKVEAAAREQVKRNIEDLAVRKLRAAGLNEEADARERELAGTRALKEASKDVTEEGQQYYAALQDIIAAEKAAAAETRRRAQIDRTVDDQNSLLGGTTAEKLRRSLNGFEGIFTQFAGTFDDLDLTTKDGLEKAKQRIRDIFAALAADGNISDQDQEIIDRLKTLFGSIDDAIGQLPDVLKPLADALDAFDERVSLLKTSLPDQLAQLAKIFTGQFGGVLDDVLKGADLGTADGRTALKSKVEDLINGILADGKITDEERPLLDALKRLLGIAVQSIDDAAGAADKSAQDAEAARQKRLADRARTASVDVELNDLTGADAFRARLGQYSDALQQLFGTFDTSSLDGIAQGKQRLRDIRDSIAEMSDAEIVAKYGMTRDEILAALTDVHGGLDGLGTALKDLANQSKDFLFNLNQEFLDATDMSRDAFILQTQKWVEDMIAQAKALGLDSPETIKKIQDTAKARIKQFDARNAPTASSASPTTDPTSADSTTRRSEFVASAVTQISSNEALRLTDIAASQLTVERGILAATEQSATLLAAIASAMFSGNVPSMLVPSLSPQSRSAGLGAGVFLQINITVSGPILGQAPQDAGQQIAMAALPYLNAYLARSAGIDALNAGRPSL